MIALILGGARCVWKDLEKAQALVGDAPSIIVATNYAGIDYNGRIDAWATLHPEQLAGWREGREGNHDYRVFAWRAEDGIADIEPVMERWRGSSGLYGAQIALDQMGADGAILCGMPMNDTEHHIHHTGPWSDAHRYRRGFAKARQEIGDSIRSMGGWSAELFGKPDADWLAARA